jgi:lipoprotein NlpI
MRCTLFALALFAFATAAHADEVSDLLTKARGLMAEQKYKEALEAGQRAVKINPKSGAAHYVCGLAQSGLKQHADAVKSFTETIKLAPDGDLAYDRRGDARLKAGDIKEAIEDFDQFLKLQPKAGPDHWRRGIALYYASRHADGVKQFESHRTVNPQDVENSVWHYLCNARATSPKKAREELIPVTKDARVPMAQVLQLFAGKLKPQDVLDAAENAKLKGDDLTAARFYANLYVALYHESEGDAKKALEHLTTAVEKYKIGDYMWDVGDAHLKMLKGKKR